jgi:hypothetical protein
LMKELIPQATFFTQVVNRGILVSCLRSSLQYGWGERAGESGQYEPLRGPSTAFVARSRAKLRSG